METQKLKQQIATAFKNFRMAVLRHTDINVKRSDGGWSVGEIASHILKATNTDLGTTIKTDRPYDQHAESITALFMDFKIKFVSAPDIEPDSKFYSKDELLLELEKTERKLIEFIENEDLTEACVDWQFPGWGNLTKYECVILFESHITRHTRQVNEFNRVEEGLIKL